MGGNDGFGACDEGLLGARGVDEAVGITITPPHLGHLVFLPAALSGALNL